LSFQLPIKETLTRVASREDLSTSLSLQIPSLFHTQLGGLFQV
jgi:hypothetical protein